MSKKSKYVLVTIHGMDGEAIARINDDFGSLEDVKSMVRSHRALVWHDKVQVSAYKEISCTSLEKVKIFNVMINQ